MSKENINPGETNEALETSPEKPTTVEDVQKAIEKKAEESVEQIDSEVDSQEKLEIEASGGELVPGADKIDVERSKIKESGKEEIEKIANPYSNLSLQELNVKWDETKKLLEEAEKNKDEKDYEANYKIIKQIEEAKEQYFNNEVDKRDNFLKSQQNVDKDGSKNNQRYKEFKNNPAQHLIDLHQRELDKEKEGLDAVKDEEEKKMRERNIVMLSDKIDLFSKHLSETKEEGPKVEAEDKEETGKEEKANKAEKVAEKSESKEKEEKAGKVKFSEEVEKAINELGLKGEDLEKIETFVNLSEGAQILALKNYNQILVDEAIQITPEKIAQIKQARKDRYQEKMGKKKGAFMAGIRNFFGSGKTKDKGFDQAYEEIKNKEDKENKDLALKAAVNWVANFDVPAKLEDGKVKLEFVDGSKFDKETQMVVEELNEAANKFARMPQYMSNISASKRDKVRYEKAQLAMKNKKEELEASLGGKKSEEEIMSILTSIDNKVSNLQNNLTDEEREEFEKSDSRLMKFLKSKGLEKSSYFVGGYAARSIIRKKLASDTTENLANAGANATVGLASAGVLAFSAVIGGVRAWHREKKKIREEDKKIGKQEHQESEEMKNRKEALKELKDITPDFLKLFKERKEPQEGETWEDYQNRTIAQWLKDEPEKAKIYLAKKDEFNQANAEFLKTQKKKFLEFKTEANFIYAESARKKIEKLVNDINKLNEKEDLGLEEKDKLIEKIEMLKTRLDYTQGKIDDGLLALGLKEKRLTNSTELFNTISQASLLVESINYQNENLPKKVSDIIGNEFRNDDGTINMKAWLESASEEELFLYRKTRIKTFLEGLDNTVTNERTKQKIKKATIGAISGGVLSFAGMKTFDYLGDTEAGQAVKEKIGEGLKYIANAEAGEQIGSGISAIQEKINAAINYGVDQGKAGLEAINGIFGGSEEFIEAIPEIDEVDAISGAAIENPEVSEESINPVAPEGSPEFVGPVEPEASEDLVKSFDELKESGLLSNHISNEGFAEGKTDSIWHSAREIFTNNAEALGYEGDVEDTGAVRKWADNMVGNAINRMDDVTDKVFEGNIISLDQNEAGEYIIEVEQGEGLKPGYLPDEAVEETTRVEPVEKIPRREINEIPHTRELPNTETPDNNVTLDDLKDTSEETPEVESDTESNESGEEQIEVDENDSNQESYSDIVGNIDQEGGERSGVQEALDRAREAREAIDEGSVDTNQDTVKDGKGDIWENREQIFEEASQEVHKRNNLPMRNVINQIYEKDNLNIQDKLILEHYNQNYVPDDKRLSDVLSDNLYLLKHDSSAAQELLSFYEIRNALGEKQIDLFYDLLKSKMENLSPEQSELLDMLKEKGSINIINHTEGPMHDKIIMNLGDQKLEFNFSSQGLDELSGIIKESDALEILNEVEDGLNQETTVIDNKRGNFSETTSSETFEDESGKTITTDKSSLNFEINNPEFLSETRDMASNITKTFTEDAKKIPVDFFNNPNEIYKVKGLGHVSFAEEFKMATKFDFNEMDDLDKKRVILWFKNIADSKMKSSPNGIRTLTNTILAPLRQKYGF